jgi:hypothetical protein
MEISDSFIKLWIPSFVLQNNNIPSNSELPLHDTENILTGDQDQSFKDRKALEKEEEEEERKKKNYSLRVLF